MREIKFRGICNVHANSHLYGSWIYGGIKFKKIKGVRMCFICDEVSGGSYSVYPKTVGQFTGLKDKNGVEIYEGDILGGVNGSINCIPLKQELTAILYEYGRFNIPLWIAKEDWDSTHYVYVVGNIHDNPELLTKN